MKKAILSTGRKGIAVVIVLTLLFTSLAMLPSGLDASAAVPTSGDKMPQYRVVSYVTSWSWPGTYNPATDEATTTVDPKRITHINYAFGYIVGAQGTANYQNGNLNSTQFPGTVAIPDPGKLRALVELKKINPDLKVLLSIGGWGMDGFCAIVHDNAKMDRFVESCIQICKQYGLDGIDMDYEYPGTSADSYDRLSCPYDVDGQGAKESGQFDTPGSKDGEGYLNLMKKFRAHSDFGWNRLLTIASGIGYDWNVTANIYGYSQQLDFINIMVYDIYGEWRNHSEFNANLYGSGSLSGDSEEGGGKVLSYDFAVNRISFRGYSRDIMNVGIPLYGRDRYYRRSTADPNLQFNNQWGTPFPIQAAGLGDGSWPHFNQVMALYDANASTDSEVLKDLLYFEDIATDPGKPLTIKSSPTAVNGASQGGVETSIGVYTKAQAEEVVVKCTGNTMKRTFHAGATPSAGPNASYAEGDITVQIVSSPIAGDVGKTVKRRYSITYDDVEDIVGKADWIQEMGYGGAMYWEYTQDTGSRFSALQQESLYSWDGLITSTIWKSLNEPRTTIEQPARGSTPAKTLNIGRLPGKDLPTISYRYDKSLDPVTKKYNDWHSRENIQHNLGGVSDKDIGIHQDLGTAKWNNKVRFFEGKLYINTSTGYHGGYYGSMPCFAPKYATSDNNMYAWMAARNPAYRGQYGTGAEWAVVGNANGYPATAIPRTEYQVPLREPDATAVRINSAAPDKKQVHVGTEVSYNIAVTGGAGGYKNISNQVWFNGVKYDNLDGYIKFEKRRTGGPYPIPTGEGTKKGTGGAKFKPEAVGTNGLPLTDRIGETRDQINPSPANAVGTVKFTPTLPGVYFILTQAEDSAGKPAAQFSQVVEVKAATDPLDFGVRLFQTGHSGGIYQAGDTANWEALGDGADGTETYSMAVYKGEIIPANIVATSNTKTISYKMLTSGTYTCVVTMTQGDKSATNKNEIKIESNLGVSVVADKTGTVAVSTPIEYTATATGVEGSAEFSFQMYKNGAKIGNATAFSASNKFTYTPDQAGTYKVEVTVKDVPGGETKTNGSLDIVVIIPAGPLTIPNGKFTITQNGTPISRSNPGIVGQTITVSIGAEGGAGGYKYTLAILRDGYVAFIAPVGSSSGTFNYVPYKGGNSEYTVVGYVTDAANDKVSVSGLFKMTVG